MGLVHWEDPEESGRQGGPETIKFLEENMGSTLNDINQSKILYDPPPRVTEIKTK